MADLMDRILLDHPIWNEIIAPNISELKRGEIPPLKTNRPALAMFALGAATFLNIETATRVRLFNFIRKAVVATDAFNLARTHYDRLFF
jgi:hypothetical protein